METPRRRVLVMGAGYVGLITAVGLCRLGHRVEVVEVRRDRLEALREGRSPLYEADLPEALNDALGSGQLTVAEAPRPDFNADVAMVCVGTPIGGDGRSDLSQLRGALADLAPQLASGVPLVIRSTLPPGTTSLVVEWAGVPSSRVLTNPEFLRQGTALSDFLHPTRIVIGHFPTAAPATIDLVASLFDRIEAPRLIVDVAAAELIKNGANAFLALKLSFTNELAGMAEAYGADVDDVLHGMSLDPRIGSQYMRPGLGFGGSCLPKELQALAASGSARGLRMHVTTAASEANAATQARFAARIADSLAGLAGRRIAVLGLAFKAGTDDVRDSPAMALVRTLVAGGASVVAHDPIAAHNAVREMPELRIEESILAAVEGADAVVIATEWPAFKALDWQEIAARMRGDLVADGRRLLRPNDARAAGLRYLAVGAPSSMPVTS